MSTRTVSVAFTALVFLVSSLLASTAPSTQHGANYGSSLEDGLRIEKGRYDAAVAALKARAKQALDRSNAGYQACKSDDKCRKSVNTEYTREMRELSEELKKEDETDYRIKGEIRSYWLGRPPPDVYSSSDSKPSTPGNQPSDDPAPPPADRRTPRRPATNPRRTPRGTPEVPKEDTTKYPTAKDLKVVPRSESQNDSKASLRALLVAMNDCLERQVTYYGRQDLQLQESAATQRPSMRNSRPPVLYNPSSFAAQSPNVRAMLLARPLAEYVLQLRMEKFGIDYIDRYRKNWGQTPLVTRFDDLLEIDNIVGSLVRCVAKRGLVPEEDLRDLYRKTFEAYDPDDWDSSWEKREYQMSDGYHVGKPQHWITFDVP